MQNLFQNICLYCSDKGQQPGLHTHRRGKRRKDLFFCRRKAVHILFPRLCLKPGASSRPRSSKPQERARVRASARLGPSGPSRAGSALTHIPRRRGPGLSLRGGSSSSPDAHRKSGPRSRAAEAAARTPERAGRRPSLSAPREAVSGSRCCPLLLLFLSTSCSPLRSYFRQPGSPSRSSSPPAPGPAGLLSAAGPTRTRHPPPKLASSPAACSQRRR